MNSLGEKCRNICCMQDRPGRSPSKLGAAGGSTYRKSLSLSPNLAPRRKSTLKQQMLPDLPPDRNKKAISHVRKMIEGFIDAATTKADIEIDRASVKDGGPLTEGKAGEGGGGEDPKDAFNLEIAGRRLIAMAQKWDWIAFEQALK